MMHWVVKNLDHVINQHRSLSDVLASDKITALEKQLCYGVCRWYYQLDALLSLLLNKPLGKKGEKVRLLLLVGLYQLMHINEPDYAVVSETVNAVKKMKVLWAVGLTNKILRRFLREKDQLLQQVNQHDYSRCAHPQWLVDRIQQDWPNDWQAILDANNQQAPMVLRINRLQTSVDNYLKELVKVGITAKPIEGCPDAIQLDQAVSVDKLPEFWEGACSVQDSSGQRVAPLFNLTAGQRVLDACAAPGSKTCHMLEIEPKLECLFAVDKDAERLKRVEDNLTRLKLDSNTVKLIDADVAETAAWWDKKPLDAILLDAPCSATGVIRRHPDIKLLRFDHDIDTLCQQQQQLLIELWPLLKPGGQLIYSTCSVLKAENEQQITQFLNNTPNAELVSQQQLLPQTNQHDGFYLAVLKSCG